MSTETDPAGGTAAPPESENSTRATATTGDELSLDAVEDLAGTAETGRTVEVKLADGAVVVARVRQIQTGPIECRVDGCFRRFDSEKGRKTHVGKMHPDQRTTECEHCGELFEASPPDQRFCSKNCADDARSNLEGLVCEGCGKVFQIRASHADQRRHCSRECRKAHNREDRECAGCGDTFEVLGSRDKTYCSRQCFAEHGLENCREERTCPECEETFEVYPSEDMTYCSTECYSASHWETKECPTCEQPFEARSKNKHLASEHCSRWCSYERTQAAERPDQARPLVEELRAEYDAHESIVGRLRANLAADGWSEADCEIYATHAAVGDYRETVDVLQGRGVEHPNKPVADRLLELCRDARKLSWRLEPETIRTAIGSQPTPQDLGNALQIVRSDAADLLEELGVEDLDAVDELPGGDGA